MRGCFVDGARDERQTEEGREFTPVSHWLACWVYRPQQHEADVLPVDPVVASRARWKGKSDEGAATCGCFYRREDGTARSRDLSCTFSDLPACSMNDHTLNLGSFHGS